MNLESRFHQHKKNFVNPAHEKKGVTGYQIDENGNYLATDGVQMLRIKAGAPGDYQILKLNGTPADKDVDRVDLERFFPEHEPRATVDLDTWLDAASAFEAVMKASGSVSDDKGNQLMHLYSRDNLLHLSFELLDGTQGEWEIGQGSDTDFSRRFDGTRLVQCLKVFSGHAVEIDITGDESAVRPLMFSAPDIDVVLMPVRVQ